MCTSYNGCLEAETSSDVDGDDSDNALGSSVHLNRRRLESSAGFVVNGELLHTEIAQSTA